MRSDRLHSSSSHVLQLSRSVRYLEFALLLTEEFDPFRFTRLSLEYFKYLLENNREFFPIFTKLEIAVSSVSIPDTKILKTFYNASNMKGIKKEDSV